MCTVDLPDRAMEDIQRPAEYVVHALRVMAARFGSKVDVMGFSQGPHEPRWAVRWWPDIRAVVDDRVPMAGPNRGDDLTKFPCADGNACR